MTAKDCIDRAIDAGELDKERGREALDLLDQLEPEYRDIMGEAGSGEAAREALRQIKQRNALRNRQRLLQARVHKSIDRALREANNPYLAAEALIDGIGVRSSHVSAQQIREVVRGRAHGMMDEFLAKFKRNLVGNVPNKAVLHDVVREMFGENTGDIAAREMAQSWANSSEFLRKQFNAAGGSIPKRKDWGMPQQHSTPLIREAGFKAWREFIMPLLDREKMIDDMTGQPLSAQGLELAINSVYQTISTSGFVNIRPGQIRNRATANRRQEHRFLAFKDADSWLAYQERFGASDVFSTLMGHIDTMARDIGAMRALGPNPTATLRYVSDTLLKRAALGEQTRTGVFRRTPEQLAERAEKRLNNLYAHYTGQANIPDDSAIAQFFSPIRQVITSAKLGAATLSAVTDVNFVRIAAKTAGLPQARTMSRMVSQLNPTNKEDRKLAVRLGLIADHWSQMSSAQNRYIGEVVTAEWSQRLSDFVLRSSGLSAWTQAGKWAFGMEFAGTLADNATRRLADLPPPLRRTLERYNIGDQAWNQIRKTKLYDHQGASFLRAEDIAARTDMSEALADDLATRVLTMIQSETAYAVPSVSLRGRAILLGDVKPGSIPGEMLRSFAMFKNFAVTLTMLHGRRTLDKEVVGNRAIATANLIMSTTIMGAMAMQLKEISKGRDPRQMFPDDPQKLAAFWGAALAQGGGLGIFGDFLSQDTSRFGGTFANTLAGPVAGTVAETVELAKQIGKATVGADNRAGNALVNYAKYNLPGSSLWYSRLALERLVFDRIEEQLDSDASSRRRRRIRKTRRDFDQEFFAPPGGGFDRAPDLSAAFE